MSDFKDQIIEAVERGWSSEEGAYQFVRSTWEDAADRHRKEIPSCPACGSTDPDCEEDCPVRIEQREQDTGG